MATDAFSLHKQRISYLRKVKRSLPPYLGLDLHPKASSLVSDITQETEETPWSFCSASPDVAEQNTKLLCLFVPGQRLCRRDGYPKAFHRMK